ncbi:MAG: TIGR04283 family arsenosugar biosynthesis glycosyltransferase [Bacteroidia bacterium]
MKISIVIPTLNEASNIKKLVKHLFKHGGSDLHQVIVSDAGSSDKTEQVAKEAGAIVVYSEVRGRAFQMNAGAKIATGDILYFVHADAIPPTEFVLDIKKAISQNKKAGCFRFRFDSNRKLLAANAYCTRFNGIFSGGGDQSLFVEKKLFDALGGFDENHVIMEDFDLVNRLRKAGHHLYIVPKEVTVSARKYDNNNYMRVNLSNLLVFSLYKIGVKPAKLARLYKKLIKPYNNQELELMNDVEVITRKENQIDPVEQEIDLYAVPNERYY